MTPVNIKLEVAELEANSELTGQRYETVVERVEHPPHKHIFIPALQKHYAKDSEHNWFLYEERCELCTPTLKSRFVRLLRWFHF